MPQSALVEVGSGRKQPFRRWCGRGRAKPEWIFWLTITHSVGEKSTETLKLRAADKYEAIKKAFQRTQELLGGLMLDDRQNPCLHALLIRQNGEGGGVAFILKQGSSNFEGALKARRPGQMFREVSEREGKRAFH